MANHQVFSCGVLYIHVLYPCALSTYHTCKDQPCLSISLVVSGYLSHFFTSQQTIFDVSDSGKAHSTGYGSFWKFQTAQKSNNVGFGAQTCSLGQVCEFWNVPDMDAFPSHVGQVGTFCVQESPLKRHCMGLTQTKDLKCKNRKRLWKEEQEKIMPRMYVKSYGFLPSMLFCGSTVCY